MRETLYQLANQVCVRARARKCELFRLLASRRAAASRPAAEPPAAEPNQVPVESGAQLREGASALARHAPSQSVNNSLSFFFRAL